MACKAATESSDTLCPACWSAMRFIAAPLCDRLGTPFPVDYGGPLLSPAAIADPPVFARARAVALYEGPARELVHRLKFNDRLELAKGMGKLMAVAGHELLGDCALIVPVPLHWTRAWSRRCNQATELGRMIAAASGVPLAAGLLKRVHRTHTQVGLTRAQRRDNLQGAFRLTAEAGLALAGRRILLVDDVMTTGATCNAAARVLLRGGAAAVDALTFARVAAEG
jgi:ComF family protein